ncbi:MAG: hydrogenase maturation protease [Acidobacteriia bacterium]|nr:hydrogenase maturation protease [Terriglobia bacterium]
MTPGSPETEPTAGPTEEDRGAAPVLVLAVGNILLGDDGCGQRVLTELATVRARWGPAVELLDGGTQGMALLGFLSGRRAVVALDAVSLGAAPGTVHHLRDRDVFAALAARGLTAHEGNAGELLRSAALLGELPPEVVVIGIEPESVATEIGLSRSVEEAVPAALRLVVEVVDEVVAALDSP